MFHIPKSDWSYEIYGDKAHIMGYNGKESESIIPKKVKKGWNIWKRGFKSGAVHFLLAHRRTELL